MVMWETLNMNVPEAILFSAKPLKIACPVCSVIFNIMSYEGNSLEDRIEKMKNEYEAHFKNNHGKEG